MAMNLPTGVPNGTVIGNYTYDSSVPGWRKTPEVASGLPAGTIVQWGTVTPPANWLICDGSAVSRANYASLFAAIGVQFGVGDGTSTFNLPDLRGRVAVGKNTGTFSTIGATGGTETHTLTIAEMPSHTHIQNAHTHTQDAHTHTSNGWVFNGANPGSIGARYGIAFQYNTGGTFSNTGVTGGEVPWYNNNTTATNQNTTATNQNTGGGGAHNNLQPYIVLNYIIKTSAGITSGDSELAARVGVVEAQNNATPSSHNYLINGAFDVWQRGSSVSHAGGGVGADMWREYTDSGSGTQSKDTSVYPAGLPPQSYKFTAAANSTNWVIWQIIESANCAPLIGQTVTFSVYLKSSVARTFRLSLGTSTTTDAAWTGSWATHSYQDFSVTTDWTRYSFTTTVPSTSRTLQFSVASNGANMANASTINVAGAQVELGQYATPFRRNSSNIKSELDACQRYYYRFTGSWANYIGMGLASTATALTVLFPFKVPMRATPTSFESYLLALENPGVNTVNVTGSYGDYTTSNTTGTIMITSSGMTVGKAYILRCSDNGAYVGWSAEL